MKRDFFRLLFELLTWLLLDLMGRWHQRRRAGSIGQAVTLLAITSCFLDVNGELFRANWSGTGLDGNTVDLILENFDLGSWGIADVLYGQNAANLSAEFGQAPAIGDWRLRVEKDAVTLATSETYSVS